MLYLYQKDAGDAQLTLQGDDHRYIFKVRRHKEKDTLYLRNLEDGLLHAYRIAHLDKKSAILELIESKVWEVGAKTSLHIAWCVIDPKSVEKVLPSLNEMGVEKITFIYCERSQKSFKLDFTRLNKILLNSSQQSGRSVMMQLETKESLEAYLETYPDAYMLNFSEHKISHDSSVKRVVIGCEGGFSQTEVALFEASHIIGLDTPLVLKSESAVCAVAAKLLL